MVREQVVIMVEFLGVLEVLGVPVVLEVLEFLEVLEVLEVLALSFHLVLTNLHSKEVLHHSWVLILSMDLR